MSENTFSVDSGVITINGNIIRCVTDYKVGSIPGFRGRVHVDLGFDAIMKNEDFVPKENVPAEIHIPFIIESTYGLDRTCLAVLFNSYTTETTEEGTREYMKFHPFLAPYKVTVLPLIKKYHSEKAKEILLQDICDY